MCFRYKLIMWRFLIKNDFDLIVGVEFCWVCSWFYFCLKLFILRICLSINECDSFLRSFVSVDWWFSTFIGSCAFCGLWFLDYLFALFIYNFYRLLDYIGIVWNFFLFCVWFVFGCCFIMWFDIFVGDWILCLFLWHGYCWLLICFIFSFPSLLGN